MEQEESGLGFLVVQEPKVEEEEVEMVYVLGVKLEQVNEACVQVVEQEKFS